MLTVVAEMQAKPGKEEELKKQLLTLIEPTRKEEGCVQYDLHVSTESAGQFVFYENWRSRELLDKHLASAHLRAFLAVAGDLLVEPPRIVTYNRIV